MSGTNEVARILLAQNPSRVDCHALAADTQIISQSKPTCHNGGEFAGTYALYVLRSTVTRKAQGGAV